LKLKFNEKNLIVENVLTQQEIDQIYREIDRAYDSYIMERYGQKISNFRMPQSALDKIVKISEEISGVNGLVLEAYQFSRYEKFVKPDGVVSMPKLIPHYDSFPEPRFTFDYQIKSNTSWPLVVEDKELTLEDNQALTFSGTHQIHWRTEKDFQDGEFIDMIFCHLSLPNSEPNSNEHWEIMKAKELSFTQTVRDSK
jgi:hypothetical protein